MTPTLFATSVLLLGSVLAEPTEQAARAILTERCVQCHGPNRQRGGLRLDRAADFRKGGDSGPVYQVEDWSKSRLLQKVKSRDRAEQMPPEGERLSDAQIKILEKWLSSGAIWTDAETQAEPQHWAFTRVVRPSYAGQNPIDYWIDARLKHEGLNRNPIADKRTLIRRVKFDLLGLPPTPEEVDAFLGDTSADAYAKLVDRFLASPQYGERWARHWLDVVRFAESHGFEMNQPRANAWPYRDWVIRSFNEDKPYDRFVQEQLAGDQLGADAATGFLVAGPWDQVKSPDPVLTANQRADELHDIVSTTGSAFLGLTIGCARCHAHKFDPISQHDYFRVKSVFAGVQHGERTVTPRETPSNQERRKQLQDRLLIIEKHLAELEPLADPAATSVRRTAVSPRLNRERFAPTSAKWIRFVIFKTTDLEPCLDELEVFSSSTPSKNVALGAKLSSSGDYRGSPEIHRLEFLVDGRYGNSRSWISHQVGRGRVVLELPEMTMIDRIVWARDREGRFQDRLPVQYRIDVSRDQRTWEVVASSDDRQAIDSPMSLEPTTLDQATMQKWRQWNREAEQIKAELERLQQQSMIYAGRLTTPEVVHRLHRGDPMSPREVIAPGTLIELAPKWSISHQASDAERRISFAKWLTHPDHPLTARVMVNRLWQQHFGQGIVDTPSDFGRNGARPTHPELLDWLASEFRQPSDDSPSWSIKHMHRLMVLSRTYQQASTVQPLAWQKDAQSRWLWRYPPRRLDAEALRDAILQTSDQLDLTSGGPGFDLFLPNTNYVRVFKPKTEFGPAEFRRMIYQQKPRMQLDDTFGAFDCPDGGQIAPKRHQSTTALQALNLLNSPFLMQQAEALAKRVTSAEPARGVQQLFRLVYQRQPTVTEAKAALAVAQKHGLIAVARALLNSNEFLYID